MKRVMLSEIPSRSNCFAGLALQIHRGLLSLLLLVFALIWARLWLHWPFLPGTHWPEGLLLLLAAATLLASLSLQLPAQNIMLASVIIVFMAGAAVCLGALTAIPFGPFIYTESMGRELFHPLPWTVPLLWLVVLLASRGVARLMLRPWRKTRAYGFRLIGITTVLVVLFDVALEPYATVVQDYWVWSPTRVRLDWYTAPCTNFLGWAMTTLLILAFATPALINKHPGTHSTKPHYSPLIIWLLFNLLFATGAAVHQLWLAVGVICASSVTVTVFALRGARW